jgi:ankyrin repeat protein
MDIFDAIKTGNIDRFNELYDIIQNSLIDNEGNTLLMIACKNGQPAIINKIYTLLSRQSCWPNCNDINKKNNMGETPLILACKYSRNIYAINLLLTRFRNININETNDRGESAFVFACSLPNDPIATINRFLEIPNIDVTITSFGQTTCLMHATVSGNLNIVKRLLQLPNININDTNDRGETAVELAKMRLKSPMYQDLRPKIEQTIQYIDNFTPEPLALPDFEPLALPPELGLMGGNNPKSDEIEGIYVNVSGKPGNMSFLGYNKQPLNLSEGSYMLVKPNIFNKLKRTYENLAFKLQ